MNGLLGMDVRQFENMTLPDGKVQSPGFEAGSPLSQAGQVWYCAAPPLTTPDLRRVFASADVQEYLDTDDVLMLGGGYIALHAVSDGTKTLRLPRHADWTDVRAGKTVAFDTDHHEITMTRGQTLIFALDAPGESKPSSGI